MTENEHDWLKQYIVDIPDFPNAGIIFKDINPLLADKNAFQYSVQKFAEYAWQLQADAIVAIESRGFYFGAPVAFSLGVPFVPIRKKGKLPGETVSVTYDLEYGSGHLEIPKNILAPGSNVLIIDDVLATGGTAVAAKNLVNTVGSSVAGFAFLIELSFLSGNAVLGESKNASLLTY